MTGPAESAGSDATAATSATAPAASDSATSASAAGTPSAPGPLAAPLPGLTTDEARERARTVGANAVETRETPYWRVLADKFWAPVPWLLEAAVAIQLATGERLEAAVVAALLVFNALLGTLQERRAGAALDALKARLQPFAVARRDGAWARVPAAELVPGDVLDLSLGAVVPADARVVAGLVSVDESMLTGESMPVDAHEGDAVHAGSLVQHGHAYAEVTATGARTLFGRAAELVRVAHAPSSEQRAVFGMVRQLVLVNGAIALGTLGYAAVLGLPGVELMRLALTALLASVPVALPATFTLSGALSALALSHRGALLTRLSAVHEAGAMDVLCSDKTGTLTQNALRVEALRPAAGIDEARLVALAATASAPSGADPLDAAIRRAASGPNGVATIGAVGRFEPFDPHTKVAQAWVPDPAGGGEIRIVKGALEAIERIATSSADVRADAARFANDGLRVIAVATGAVPGPLALAGLIALADPPRADSASLVRTLADLGVRTVMVTGDAAATAGAIAKRVGLTGAVYPANAPLEHATDLARYGVFARVLPEDKFHLVDTLQRDGHVVGMCGDGANDAPALRQAQMGVAVASATDVAKAAAAIVLTEPGLAGIVAAVREGRIAFQRLLAYTLNMLVKKIEVVLLLGLGLALTHAAVLTPAMMVVLLVTNDFLTMSLTTDRALPAQTPQTWQMKPIVRGAAAFGLLKLAFSGTIVALGQRVGRLPVPELQSVAFAAVAFGNQAFLFAIRERGRLWHSMPSRWMLLSSALDVSVVCALVLTGTWMAPLPAWLVGTVALAAGGFALVLDRLKTRVLRSAGIARP